MTVECSEMTDEEKKEERIRRFFSAEGKTLKSQEGEKAYKARAKRFCDAVNR